MRFRKKYSARANGRQSTFLGNIQLYAAVQIGIQRFEFFFLMFLRHMSVGKLMIKPRIIYFNLYTSVIKSVCEKYPLMLYICLSSFVLALAYDLAYAVYGLECALYHITHQ